MQNHKDLAMADFSFAPPANISEEAEAAVPSLGVAVSAESASSGSNGVHPLEVDGSSAAASTTTTKTKNPRKLKQTFRKLGGALNQRLNVAKWIADLEQDQNLADQLDRINGDNVDDQERHEICRQAMEACLDNIRQHLVEFLQDNPQATYEEWICELHPDNINSRLEGLTSTPMIDHRFYVADSDHRILWNEHLNYDLNDPTNLQPVRHFVEARRDTPASTTNISSGSGQEDINNPSTDTTGDNNNNNTEHFIWETIEDAPTTSNTQPQQPQATDTSADSNNNNGPPVDLLS